MIAMIRAPAIREERQRARVGRRPTGGAAPLARRVVTALGLALLPAAAAQADSVAPMRDLLDRGYYNAAAQLEGPNLVLRLPDDPEAHYLYARALWLTGDAAGARREIDAALALEDDPPADHLHLDGLLKAAEGDQEGALRALQRAFESSGAYQHAMDWGMIAWRSGQIELALEAYDAAGRSERGLLEPWPALNRGRILALVGRDAEATEAFETAIEVFERSDDGGVGPPPVAYVEAFYRLGQLRERAGDLGAAEQDYKAARSIDPNYAPAIEALDALARRLE